MSQCKFSCPNFLNKKFKNYCRCNNKNQCCDCTKKGKCKWCVSLNSDNKTTSGKCIPIQNYNDKLCPPYLQDNDCLNENINKYIVKYPTINIVKKDQTKEKSSEKENKDDDKENKSTKTIINKYIYTKDDTIKNEYKNYLIFILFIIIIVILISISFK